MKRPTLFKPTQKALEKVANVIAENLSDEKIVIAGEKKLRGKVGIGKTKTMDDEFKERFPNAWFYNEDKK